VEKHDQHERDMTVETVVIETPEALMARVSRLIKGWGRKSVRAVKKAGGFIKRAAKWVAGTAAAELVIRNAKRGAKAFMKGYLWAGGKVMDGLRFASRPILWAGGSIIALMVMPKAVAVLLGLILVALVVAIIVYWRLNRQKKTQVATWNTATNENLVAEVADLADRAAEVASDAEILRDDVVDATIVEAEQDVAEVVNGVSEATPGRMRLATPVTPGETAMTRYAWLEAQLQAGRAAEDVALVSEATMRLYVISIKHSMQDGQLAPGSTADQIYRRFKSDNEGSEFDWQFSVMLNAARNEVKRLKEMAKLQAAAVA